MKKLVLLICSLMLLSGCSSMFGANNITGLLSSPKHSQTESEIAQVVGSYLGENITLKYSQSQGYSAPIQFMDVDADGQDEALVFYYAPNTGTNIRFALVDNTDDGWNIVFDKEGLGGDVFCFDTIELGGLNGRQIVVGYLPNNISENFFVTYFTDQSVEMADYTEVCEDILVADATDDGQQDIILTSRLSDGGIKIKLLTYTEGSTFKAVGTKNIRRGEIEITQLALGKTYDGKTALYVDYIDSYNKMYTEAGTLYSGAVLNCLNKEYISRVWPYSQKLNSYDIDSDGVREIPVVMQDDSGSELPVLKYIQWNDYSAKETVAKSFGVYNTSENIYVALPQELMDMTYTEYNSNLWRIMWREDDTALVSFSKDYLNKTTNDNMYTLQLGAETWTVEFSDKLDQIQKDYIIDSITIFD